ncbi:hypothetical protein CHLNCDRAFT_58621 [Chlorella variabilis]|uniref:Uncharacterized protein n=1 Tax=Chlorella variabilis TaxID=554065 RepID=E1ZLY6_CHLVA|nr:hypothetical protein CHLNCDRAFT_58621 [Chlorella variabilis]EFN53349.1 hypothetical protein CHLNCDRAFT_58621 [Chlorella variabilis]|eukprot:XP_005845451.1 hypothetical protein CHLNCDRAFT_58621 [Chlorella variabilis]
MGAWFIGNTVRQNLLGTGAFEVSYDGTPIFSKLDTGRMPTLPELVAGIAEAMAAAGNPAGSGTEQSKRYSVSSVQAVCACVAASAATAVQGVVETATRRKLSIISFNLLLPAFNFFNLAQNIDVSTVTSYLPFAANSVLSNVLGMLMGWGSNWLVRTPLPLRYHVVAASGFGNLNSLPLLIVFAVCKHDDLPFYQVLGDQCTSMGFGYIAIGTAATQMFTWQALDAAMAAGGQPAGNSAAAGGAAAIQAHPDVRSFALDFSADSSSDGGADDRSERSSKISSSSRRSGGGAGADHARSDAPALRVKGSSTSSMPMVLQVPSRSSTRAASFSSAAGSPDRLPGSQMNGEGLGAGTESRAAAPLVVEVVMAGGVQEGQPGAQEQLDERPAPRPPSRARRYLRLVWLFTRENVLRMPCIGAGLGFIVGVITPIKDLLFPIESATLGFLMGALFSIQAALIFVSSFVLGSVLSKGPGSGTRALGWRPLLLVVLIRMAVLPLIGAVVVVGFVKLGWYKPLDPVYAFILLQQFCVPTANQMQNIASMSGNREREMGALIFWQYVCAFVAIPCWMVAYLWCMDHFFLYPGA